MGDRLRVVRLAFGLARRAGGWRVPIIAACGIALGLQPPAMAFALKLLTDGALGDEPGQVYAGFAVIAALVAIMFSAYGIMVPLQTTVTERASRLFEQDVMGLAASFETLEPHERPDVADRVETLRTNSQLLIAAAWTVIANLSFFIGAGAALALLARADRLLLVLPLFGIPLGLASLRSARVRDDAATRTAEGSRLAQHLFAVATGAAYGKELRVFGLGEEIGRRYHAASRAVDRQNLAADLRVAAMTAGGWLLFVAAWVAAISVVSLRARDGDGPPGDVVLAVAAAALVQGYVSSAVTLVHGLAQALATARRYLWLVDLRSEAPRRHGPAPAALSEGIRFEGVSFRYPGTDDLVLRDVDLLLPAGSVVGLVGDNGAGKTTLVKLLLGMYQPTEGRITVDGADLAEIDVRQWRSRTAGAFQDFARFEFVVRESIGVGELDRVDDEVAVRSALDRASLGTTLPPMDAQLGRSWPGGVDVSGGEWQQIAVARGMMRTAPLLRVLDEPTASLDADVEHALFERYSELARPESVAAGTVTVMTSHRFSTVRMTDTIVVLEGGRVTEVGAHAALVEGRGLYAELYELQAKAYR
jgi:ATP-binding cassette subfamily B protein